MSEIGAASARTTGRTAALNSAMRMTANAASSGRAIEMPRKSQSVASNAIVATTSVITSRLSNAHGPPRHSHSTRSWVP